MKSLNSVSIQIQINDEILTGETTETYVSEDDTVHSGSIVSEPGTAMDLKNMTTTSPGAAEYPVVVLQVCGVMIVQFFLF